MLSAVESHLGPGRAYFAGPAPGIPQILPPPPAVQIPTGLHQAPSLNIAAAAAMSAEFARPHPKPRYNGGPPRNGLSAIHMKYSDPNAPVNLAMGTTSSPSPIATPPSPKDAIDAQAIKMETLDAYAAAGANQRLPFPTSHTLNTAQQYQQVLNSAYQLYNRTAYDAAAAASFYPSHPLVATRTLPRPGGYQLESYAPYMTPTVPGFSPPGYPVSPHLFRPNGLKQGYGGGSGASGGGGSIQQPSMPPVVSTTMVKEEKGARAMRERQLQQQQQQLAPAGVQAGFKVPSGKEGSMKYRILARPYSEKEGGGKQRSPDVVPAVRSPNLNNNTPTNFIKGARIELASGEVKCVEEMRAEDFQLSAKNSSNLQLVDSTVVKLINVSTNNVMITFSYDNNRSKVDIEATSEHPFFVYGKGWASCNPDGSMRLFNLKCQPLQVGDVCISLKPRDKLHQASVPAILSPIQSRPTSLLHQPYAKETVVDYSRRSAATIPTTATSLAVTSRPAAVTSSTTAIPAGAAFDASHAADISKIAYANRLLELQKSGAFGHDVPRPLSHETPFCGGGSGSGFSYVDQAPLSMVMTKSPYSAGADTTTREDEASLARKRRWSAPDNLSEDEQLAHQFQRSKFTN